MKEIDTEVLKIHPDKVVNIGNHRMDAQGNTIYKQVEKKYLISNINIKFIKTNIIKYWNTFFISQSIFILKFWNYCFKVPLRQSEVHISEILDNVCEKMNDYVRANKKSNNHLILINLMSPLGAMNPEINQVDIIQDGDLNKSLPHYVSAIFHIL